MNSLDGLQIFLRIISSFIVSIFVLRFMLQLFGASYLNPICAALYKATQPVVRIFAKLFPKRSRVDWSLLLSTYIVALILQIITRYLQPIPFSITSTAMVSVVFCLNQALNILFFATLITVIASWFKPQPGNPLLNILFIVTTPFLKKIRVLLPKQGAIDFTPFIFILAIKAIEMFVLDPLQIYILSL